MKTERSQIIFLHGASSSGKSTLARALQDALPLPFWHISIDHLRDSGVLPSARLKAGDFSWSDMRPRFFDGYHRSLAAYASAGNNLIVEHILDGQGMFEQLVDLFAPFDVFFVALHCPPDLLTERERLRGDRPIGSAIKDYHTIHQDRDYDLQLDGLQSIDNQVATLMDAWRKRKGPSVFHRALQSG